MSFSPHPWSCSIPPCSRFLYSIGKTQFVLGSPSRDQLIQQATWPPIFPLRLPSWQQWQDTSSCSQTVSSSRLLYSTIIMSDNINRSQEGPRPHHLPRVPLDREDDSFSQHGHLPLQTPHSHLNPRSPNRPTHLPRRHPSRHRPQDRHHRPKGDPPLLHPHHR